VARRRGDHNRLGFAVQLATVRFLGTFLADPGDVPGEVVDYIVAQLDVDAASMSTYTQREKTRLEHRWEIARAGGYRIALLEAPRDRGSYRELNTTPAVVA